MGDGWRLAAARLGGGAIGWAMLVSLRDGCLALVCLKRVCQAAAAAPVGLAELLGRRRAGLLGC